MNKQDQNQPLRAPIVTVCGHVDHGKCVAGDTLIALDTGELKTAKQIFEENFEEDKVVAVDDGIFQDVSKKGIKISSFDGEKIVSKNITHIWRRKAEKLIEIKIASGDVIQTTPEHLFFIFENNLISEKRADLISEKDFLVFPTYIKTIDFPIKKIIIDRIKLLDNFVCFVNQRFDFIFKNLLKEEYKIIERKLSLKNLGNNIRKRRFRIKDLFLIGYYMGVSDEDIYSVIDSVKNSSSKWRAGHTSKKVSLPSTEDPERLGYILGCLAGDGHLTKTNVILNNNNKDVQEEYSKYIKEVFNLDSKIEQGHTCQIVKDSGGRTFMRLLSEVFDIYSGNKSGRIKVPDIAKKNKEVFRGFFAGLFDTDGYVSSKNGSIEITSKSQDMIRECSILLLNFGILSSFYEKNGFYNLKISNKEYLRAFLETIKPRLQRRLDRVVKAYERAVSSRIFDILPLDKKLFKNLKFSEKKNKAIPFFNKYIKSQNITRDFAFKVICNLKESNDFSDKLKNILEKDIRFVKVKLRKEIKNKEKYVYDFTVPETKNFIAERFIIHNTSILDCFRGSSVQEGEAGGITQRISFTNYPAIQIKLACSLIEKYKINLEIPGFLFIDTPGHAAFTNLRKRGGSLADLAILVVNIKEGIKPQTAEVLQILKANKTPFFIALNKIDSISGWKKQGDLKESIEGQALNVKEEFDESLLIFQGSLKEHGFDSELYYDVDDFTKKIAIVPCSARTKQGIPELLYVLCGLCQRFLKEKLKISEEAKGVILEVKREKGMEYAEAILYDGSLDEGDELVIANFGEPIVTKVRAIQEIQPLSKKYVSAKKVLAATGVRMQLTNKEALLPGMPFQEVKDKDIEKIKAQFKKEISGALKLDKQGIIIKADSLGSLEALITLLKQERIEILKAGIGPINKGDVNAAKANLEVNPLNAIVIGFNTELEEDISQGNVKILSNEVIYKLIEELQEWRKKRSAEIEKEKLLGLATICKLEILPKFVFRNSNPAIFGVRVCAGKAKIGIKLIDDNGEEVARIKSLQHEKRGVEEAVEGQELALALPGITFDRQLKFSKFLYSDISKAQFKEFKKHKDLLSASELKTLQEISDIKIRRKEDWGS